MLDLVLKTLRQVLSGSYPFSAKGVTGEIASNGKLTFSFLSGKDGSITIVFKEDETAIFKVKKIIVLAFSLEYIKISKDDRTATIKLSSGLFNKEIVMNLLELQDAISGKK